MKIRLKTLFNLNTQNKEVGFHVEIASICE